MFVQTRDMFTTENYVGVGKDNMTSCSKVSIFSLTIVHNCCDLQLSALFHHIEQQDENIRYVSVRVVSCSYSGKYCTFLLHLSISCSDEGSVNKVMPKHFQNNTEFYSQTVMVSDTCRACLREPATYVIMVSMWGA